MNVVDVRRTMLRIACCNHKGGVGKTTCSVNLAAGLARLGWKILAVDADPQAHLSASLGLTAAPADGLAGALRGREVAAIAIRDAGVDVLPASAELADVEGELAGGKLATDAMVSVLDGCLDFDAVVIDCPPHLGPLTRLALAAADAVLVPMTPDFLAMQSLAWLLDTLAGLTAEGHGGPAVLGIAINRFSARKRLHREVRDTVNAHFPGLAFDAVIRENIALAEAPSFGQDIFRYAPRSAGTADFAALSREAAQRLQALAPRRLSEA